MGVTAIASKIISLRTQIRQALLKRLSELKGYRVYDHPSHPLAIRDLPALSVRFEQERDLSDWTTVLRSGVLVHSYECPVRIQGTLCASKTLQTALENLALDIMRLLMAEPTLGGVCKSLRFENGTDITLSSEGEQPLGSVQLQLILLYRVAENALTMSCD